MYRPYDNCLDEFLNQWGMTDVPHRANLQLFPVSAWRSGNAELGTDRSEELLVDTYGETFVILGRGGPNTFWCGDEGLQMLVLPKSAAHQYIDLRAAYDADSANIFDEEDELCF